MSSRGAHQKQNRKEDAMESERGTKEKVSPNVDMSSPVIQAFLSYQTELDQKHDKYERLVKLSRDVTIESKRSIFLLHRISSEEEKPQVLDEAEAKLKKLETGKWRDVAVELTNEDPYKFQRAYSPGLQEYIEALSFHHYLKTGGLISVGQVQKRLVFRETKENLYLQELDKAVTSDVEKEDTAPKGDGSSELVLERPQGQSGGALEGQTVPTSMVVRTLSVHVDPVEYILGLADLTGELMRMAIHSVGTGDLSRPFEHCNMIRIMHDAFVSFGNVHRELPRKLYTLKSSLRKVETACYALQVRGSEIPKHMLADVFNNPDREAFRVDDDIPASTE